MSGDPNLLENHCGAFGDCNIWAPMYRQAGMLAQACKNPDTHTAKADDKFIKPLLVAYADVKRAFELFLDRRPDRTRPFVVAGHSQGSIILTKILRECVAGQGCEPCLVAAYLTGGYVPLDLFESGGRALHNCTGPEDVGCVISFDTRTADLFVPQKIHSLAFGYGLWPHHIHYLLHERYCGARPTGTDDVSKDRLQINPMTWTTDGGGEYLGAKSPGSDTPAMPAEGGVAYGAKVRVASKAVFVPDPRSWCKNAPSMPAKEGNLHAVDLQFWYYNIRENVPKRVAAWRRARQEIASRQESPPRVACMSIRVIAVGGPTRVKIVAAEAMSAIGPASIALEAIDGAKTKGEQTSAEDTGEGGLWGGPVSSSQRAALEAAARGGSARAIAKLAATSG